MLSGGHKTLKIKEIFRHLLQIIKHPNPSHFLVKDYSSMLLHDVLTCHQYTTDVPHVQWTGTQCLCSRRFNYCSLEVFTFINFCILNFRFSNFHHM